jgi:hypothetical protein
MGAAAKPGGAAGFPVAVGRLIRSLITTGYLLKALILQAVLRLVAQERHWGALESSWRTSLLNTLFRYP